MFVIFLLFVIYYNDALLDSTRRESGLELSSPKNSKEHSNALRAAAGMDTKNRSLHYLDKASMLYGGSYQKSEVDSVKLVIRLFPFLGNPNKIRNQRTK